MAPSAVGQALLKQNVTSSYSFIWSRTTEHDMPRLSMAELKKVQRHSQIQNHKPKMFPKVRKSRQVIQATKERKFFPKRIIFKSICPKCSPITTITTFIGGCFLQVLLTFSLKMVSKVRKSQHIPNFDKTAYIFGQNVPQIPRAFPEPGSQLFSALSRGIR